MSEKLGIRAINVLKNLGVSTPEELTALAEASGAPMSVLLLGTVNCGRKTLREILDWHQAGKPLPFPSVFWVRIDKDYAGQWRVFSVSNEPRNEPTWYRARVEAEQNKPETGISEQASEQVTNTKTWYVLKP